MDAIESATRNLRNTISSVKQKDQMDPQKYSRHTKPGRWNIDEASITDRFVGILTSFDSNFSQYLENSKDLEMNDALEVHQLNPVFQKVGCQADEGGYNGLLVNMLSVDSNFAYDLYGKDVRIKQQSLTSSTALDIHMLDRCRKQLRGLVIEIQTCQLCPDLSNFREEYFSAVSDYLPDREDVRESQGHYSICDNDHYMHYDDHFDDYQQLSDDISRQMHSTFINGNLVKNSPNDDYEIISNLPDLLGNTNQSSMEISFPSYPSDICRIKPKDSQGSVNSRGNSGAFDFWNYMEPESWQMSKLIRIQSHNCQSSHTKPQEGK